MPNVALCDDFSGPCPSRVEDAVVPFTRSAFGVFITRSISARMGRGIRGRRMVLIPLIRTLRPK